MFTPFQDDYLLIVPQYHYKLLKKWYAACDNDDVEICDHFLFFLFFFNYRRSSLVTADGMHGAEWQQGICCQNNVACKRNMIGIVAKRVARPTKRYFPCVVKQAGQGK